MAKKYAVKNNSTIMAKKAHNKLDYYLRTPAVLASGDFRHSGVILTRR